MVLLEVEKLSLSYRTDKGELPAVSDVSFTLEEGKTLGIVGESGAGKSSLSLGLMRLLPANVASFGGKMILGGHDCLALTPDKFRRQIRWRQISMVFQGAMDSLNPVIKVGKQIAEPMLIHGMSREKSEIKARELLEMVRLLPEINERYAHELSGGMKQRVMIAMALALDPKLVILDEPTSALDVIIQAQIMNLLKRFKRELNLSSLFVTHDLALASDLCDAIAVMYAGEIVEMGTTEEILITPQHPYTQKLLASIPRLLTKDKPEFIPGSPPQMTELPQGCYFAPRCHRIFQACDKHPAVSRFRDGRHIRCWLYEEGNE
jgi:oligopeptide/dipeptide ABC transporter ATP-binding protein